jgi:uncharacterized protein
MSMYSVTDYVIAGVAGLIAGAINAIAGGGTLVSFPALVAIGVPKVQANVTNTVALCPGYLGGALAQRGELHGEGSRLRIVSVAAGLGGLTGSVLLLTTAESAFARLVPWLILMACALLGGQNWIRRWLRIGQHRGHASLPVTAVVVYLTSIYGGYFGAGLGIMLLAVLGLLSDASLTKLNATKSLLALVINVVAALFFVFSGKVAWGLALVMSPASLLGGAVGGRLVTVIKPGPLRAIVVAYGSVLAVWYLVR